MDQLLAFLRLPEVPKNLPIHQQRPSDHQSKRARFFKCFLQTTYLRTINDVNEIMRETMSLEKGIVTVKVTEKRARDLLEESKLGWEAWE
jgi:hypothetical protein